MDNDADCDDGNAAIFPPAMEIWYDGIDSNCDGLSDLTKMVMVKMRLTMVVLIVMTLM